MNNSIDLSPQVSKSIQYVQIKRDTFDTNTQNVAHMQIKYIVRPIMLIVNCISMESL